MTDEINSIESFEAFLEKRTRETWDEHKIPYYFSVAGGDLINKQVNYRQFTDGKRLAQWASERGITGTRFLSHPTIKAKVGLIPEGEDFDFNNHSSPDKSKDRASKKQGQLLIKFVRSLTQIPEVAVAKLNIPAEVLISLLDE